MLTWPQLRGLGISGQVTQGPRPDTDAPDHFGPKKKRRLERKAQSIKQGDEETKATCLFAMPSGMQHGEMLDIIREECKKAGVSHEMKATTFMIMPNGRTAVVVTYVVDYFW